MLMWCVLSLRDAPTITRKAVAGFILVRPQTSIFGRSSYWSVGSFWREAAKIIKKKEGFQVVYSCQVV